MILRLGVAAINLDYVTDVKDHWEEDIYMVYLVHGNHYIIKDSVLPFDDFVKKLEENQDALQRRL